MKKLFALLLAVVMVVGLFAACVQTPAPTTGTQAPTTGTQAPTTGNDGTTAGTEPTEPAFEYPLENAVQWEYNSWWGTWQSHHESFADVPWVQEFTKNTGIPAPTYSMYATDEEFNAMLASGDYPDVFQKTNGQLPGGPQGCIDEEIIIPLNDLIDKYMPNLKALLEKYPETAKAMQLADGTYYSIPVLGAEEPRNSFVNGPYIRADLMKKFNLTTIPETIDEWYDLLKAFKDNGIKAPFAANIGQLTTGGPFIGAYNGAHVNGEGISNDGEGNLFFAYTTDAYKEYVKMLKKFNDAGLFGDDFFAIDAATIKANTINGDSAAAHGYLASGIQSLTVAGKEINPDFEFVAPKFPAVTKGGLTFGNCSYPMNPGYSGYGAYITTDCEEEKYESVCRWFDYFYSEEGMMIVNYGKEGETYDMVDGKPVFKDSFLNPNKEGWTTSQWQQEWILTGSGISFISHGAGYPQTLTMDSSKNALELWTAQNATDKWTDRTIPGGLQFDSEATEDKIEITTELIQYAKGEIANFVKGDKDIDKDWDAFVKACEDFGSKELVEIWQASYDAYFEALN